MKYVCRFCKKFINVFHRRFTVKLKTLFDCCKKFSFYSFLVLKLAKWCERYSFGWVHTWTIHGRGFFKPFITVTTKRAQFFYADGVFPTYAWRQCTFLYIGGTIMSSPARFTVTGSIPFVTHYSVLFSTVTWWLTIHSISVTSTF